MNFFVIAVRFLFLNNMKSLNVLNCEFTQHGIQNGNRIGKSYLLVIICSFITKIHHIFAIRHPVTLYHANEASINQADIRYQHSTNRKHEFMLILSCTPYRVFRIFTRFKKAYLVSYVTLSLSMTSQNITK